MIKFSLGRRLFGLGRIFGNDPTLRSFNVGEWGAIAITFRRRAPAEPPWRLFVLLVLAAALLALRFLPGPAPAVIHNFTPSEPIVGADPANNLGGGNYQP